MIFTTFATAFLLWVRNIADSLPHALRRGKRLRQSPLRIRPHRIC